MKRAGMVLMVLALLAMGASAGTLTGTVTDSTGAAVSRATVIVRTGVSDGGRCPYGMLFRGLTDEQGMFQFEDVPEGTWQVRAAKRLVGFTTVPVDVPAEGEVQVELQLPGCDGTGPGDGGRWRHRIRQHVRIG